MKKRYPINKHNSTVCGYPGRDFDWSKFDWEGKSIYIDKCHRCEHKHEDKAPLPWVDDGLIGEGNQYLHVPYDWAEHSTIYRVRPSPSMYAGEKYRGHKVLSQRAVKDNGIYYWELELEDNSEKNVAL